MSIFSLIKEFFANLLLGYSILGYNFLSLIIPSTLTVIGWIWAVKQVNLAHEKNRELQHEIMKQSIKDSLYKEFVRLYSDIAESIMPLVYDINHVSINMAVDEQKTNSKLTFGWRDLFDKLNQSYAELGKNIDKLEIWLDASSEFIPNSSEIYAIITEYENDFTTANAQGAWPIFQATFAGIISREKPNIKLYQERSRKVVESLMSLRTKLKESAKAVQRYFVTRSEK